MNVSRTSNEHGIYDTVRLPQDMAREPCSPPDALNFPEPIVHSRSELERLNIVTADYSPFSIVDARSDPVGYSGPSMDSPMSIQSPEQSSMIDRQAEAAWRVDTLPEQGSVNYQNKDSVPSRATVTEESNIQNDFRMLQIIVPLVVLLQTLKFI